jgi:hypothetical protein
MYISICVYVRVCGNSEFSLGPSARWDKRVGYGCDMAEPSYLSCSAPQHLSTVVRSGGDDLEDEDKGSHAQTATHKAPAKVLSEGRKADGRDTQDARIYEARTS